MLLELQSALPRPGVCTLTSPPVPKREEDAVIVRGFAVVEVFSQPHSMCEFRGESGVVGKSNAQCALCPRLWKLQFLMAGEDLHVVDTAPDWELKPKGGSEKAWCWKVFDCSDGEPKTRNLALKFVSTEIAHNLRAFLAEGRGLVRLAVEAARGVG